MLAIAQVGRYVEVDAFGYGNKLVASDWEKADFRFPIRRWAGEGTPYAPTPSGYVELAVNVKVTGRTVQRVRNGFYAVRCQITFVGDGEPNQTVSGWIEAL